MVKLNKIYTRTGDNGTTGLVDGSRLSKNDVRVRAYGEVDETNSVIGLVRLNLENQRLDQMRAAYKMTFLIWVLIWRLRYPIQERLIMNMPFAWFLNKPRALRQSWML